MTNIKSDMKSADTAQDRLVDSLLSDYLTDKPPRVWSLLVTLFGDLAQDRGAHLSNSFLITIFDMIGIKPDALRVALFRLRKENWIITSRIGRNSKHALTEWGRAQCLDANPRIYGNPVPHKNAYLILADPATPLSASEIFQISAHTYISNAPTQTKAALETELLQDRPIPHWISERLYPQEIVSASIAFHNRLLRLDTQIDAEVIFSPLQIALLRSLIVHDWRRIALKLPPLPAFLFPPNLKIEPCQYLVHKYLSRLPKPSPEQIHNSLAGISPHT